MKKINIVILLSVLILTMTLSACNYPEENDVEQETDQKIITAVYTYVNSEVTFEAIVNKPTPCHVLDYDYRVLQEDEKNIVEIQLKIIDTEEVCAQVITPDDISDTFEVVELQGKKPDEVRFVVEENK